METVAKLEKVSDMVPDAITQAIPTTGGAVPPQGASQTQPGVEDKMHPKPEYIRDSYKGSGKLAGKVALITGGDSGIGRAVAVHYAREGAKGVAILYKGGQEDVDAKETVRLVEAEGGQCIALVGDVGDKQACQRAVDTCVKHFGALDVLVSNAAEQHMKHSIAEITPEQLEATFRTNVFAAFFMVQAALPHLKSGSSIIITTSVLSFQSMSQLMDYSTTKGCLTTLTRSLAQHLVDKGIRVNAVAPGPIWTPFIPATFPKAAQIPFQTSVPMMRAGQPSECAPCYVMLASEDGSYYTGQVLNPNGGVPVS